ncbi:MAG: DUF1501 domain-containing protein [Rhodobacteraceae bacterium]|nr:DUF1501 domain-containing protein [Paracoccaceae bacterium]
MTLSRRAFLTRTAAVGCSAAASPLITPMTFASATSENRLVVIILRGAMDGLHVVAPIGDPIYAGLRPTLSQTEFADLDGFFALPPELHDLLPMWHKGELAFAHAVSTPYRERRSHFDGQDLLEAGKVAVDARVRESGWLNRMLSLMPGVEQETAFSVGREDMLVLRGDAPSASWSPEGRVDLSPQARLLLSMIYEKDPLFEEAGRMAMALAEQMEMEAGMAGKPINQKEMADNMRQAARRARAGDLATFAARRMLEDTRIASFSIGGWDTHQRQKKSMRRAMRNLSDALIALQNELGPVWAKTTVMAVTEFGRTVRENGSEGTDHGTGGAMVLAGGAVRGGRVYGDWPGIAEAELYRQRDLMPTRDLRTYAGWAIRNLYGIETSAVTSTVFPDLDLGDDPRFLL